MNTYAGFKIIESLYLEQDGEPYQVRRSWCERLFTRPWRPLVSTREVIPKVPYRGFVKLNETTIVMHPAMIKCLQELAERAPYAS